MRNLEGSRLADDEGTRNSVVWRKRIMSWAEQTNRAYMLALRTTGSEVLAEEAVQEAYVHLLQNPPEDRGEEAAVAYFMRMVHGLAVGMIRSSARRRRREEIHGMGNDGKVRSPEEFAVRREAAEAARMALIDLPREEREAICLCCEQRLSRRLAAEILQQPEQTVVDRVRRGLEKLRLRLGEMGLATVAPVALGDALGRLGIPVAPESLTDKIRRIYDSGTVSFRASPGNSGNAVSKAILCVALATAAGAAAWFFLQGAPIEQAHPWTIETSSGVGNAPASVSVTNNLFRHWDFVHGLATDLEVLQGDWTWIQGDEHSPGAMDIPDGTTAIRLPVSMPQGPVCVTVRVRWSTRIPNKGHWSSTAGWEAGGLEVPYKHWPQGWLGSPEGNYEVRHYFLGSHVFEYPIRGNESRVTDVREYATPYPSKSVYLAFSNDRLSYQIEEIEVRSLDQVEIPAKLEHPEILKKGRRMADMGPQLKTGTLPEGKSPSVFHGESWP